MISTEKKTIEEILKDSKHRLSIPEYQRGYNWGISELEEMISDFQNNSNDGIYLGSFIFKEENQTEMSIVDGQQRLTSISLLLIAAREHAKLLRDTSLANEIQNTIARSSVIRKTNEPKIVTSENIRLLYEEMASFQWDGNFPLKIGTNSIKRQVNRLKPIYNLFVRFYNPMNANDLQTFIKNILDSYVIVVNVEVDEDVLSIFERTNARGLDLNIGDLLKNLFFSFNNQGINDAWDEVVQNANGRLQKLLKYYWYTINGHTQQSLLYRQIRTHISQPQTTIVDFVSDLQNFSEFFKRIDYRQNDGLRDWLNSNGLDVIGKTDSYFDSLNRSLWALQFFKVSQHIPVVYSLLKLYSRDSNSKKQPKSLIKVIQTIECFHFVNNVITGRVGNEVETFYANFTKVASIGTDFSVESKKLIEHLKQKKVKFAEFKSNFSDVSMYDQSSVGIINYIYDRINNWQAQGGQYFTIFNPTLDTKRNFNIEHWLPQSAKSNYPNDQDTIDLIGNLLIIPRHSNSSFGNLAPNLKMEHIVKDPKHTANLRYFHSFVSSYGPTFHNWDLEKIKKRTDDLAKYSYETIWNF